MARLRLIARLDVKAPHLIKGTQLEGLRKVGDPHEFAKEYFLQGVDEILYMDVVASLYGRNSLTEIIEKTTEDIFVPITVGGGVRTADDVAKLLQVGADKVAINTAATAQPELISELSRRFGSQCVVLSIEAKQQPSGHWEAFTDNGREPTGRDVIEWAKYGEELGAGEILVTSVDNEGTRNGFDIALMRQVNEVVNIPVIASGGMGTHEHAISLLNETNLSGIAMADILHFKRSDLSSIRASLNEQGFLTRQPREDQ